MVNSNYKTIVMVPKKMKEDLLIRVIKDGYGARGKAKWISKAINKFLSLENYSNYVEISEDMGKLDAKETVDISVELKAVLDKSVENVRKIKPLMEGAKSKIIRAALIQGLIRGVE